MVRAVLHVPGSDTPVEIKRCMAAPNILECDPAIAAQLEPIIMLAQQGQHVLTRREILKYITAEASTRAQEIQELLNVSEIEDIRKALVRVQNDLAKEASSAEQAVKTAKTTVNATVREKTYREDLVLAVINQNRAVLGGLPITALHATDLKIGLTPPAVILQGDSVNTTMLERDIQSLIDIMAVQNREHIARADEGLRSLLKIIRSDTHMLHALSRLHLTEMGLTLIDETGACPLCDTSWPPGKLQEHLEHRIETAKSAADLLGRVKSLSTTMSDPINASIVNIQKVIPVVQVAHLDNEVQQLQSWLTNLQNLSEALNSVIDHYPDSHTGSFAIFRQRLKLSIQRRLLSRPRGTC
jgi:DNA repair exonuclease SbcCD ATPase subunit